MAGTGGLTVRIDPDHSLSVLSTGGTVRAVAVVGGLVHEFSTVVAAGFRYWKIRAIPAVGDAHSPTRGPDLLVAGVCGHTGFPQLGQLDGRYVSTEVAGGMIGRVIGVLSVDGSVQVRSFVYRGSDLAGGCLDQGQPDGSMSAPFSSTSLE